MTTATTRPRRRRLPRFAAKGGLKRSARIAAAAAAYAAGELLATVFIGRFFSWGRAEAWLFLAFRPWLLLVAAVLAQRLEWRARYGFYTLALLLAGLSESLFLTGLGASSPWPEAARGMAAGAALVLLFDLVLRLGGRLRRMGQSVATGALAVLLVVPNSLRSYEALVTGGGGEAAGAKRDLMLMSALPLVWGEKGPFDPGSKPAAAYEALSHEFRIRPLDVLDEKNLDSGRLLLLAQPRALAPEELVALDAWVRRGGRALILTDPRLAWPSELPLGDIRRPPPIGLLDPLLTHWGLRLEPGPERTVVRQLGLGGVPRRLVMAAPGSFVAGGGDCRVDAIREIARCRIGAGRAMLLADADMMHDDLWVGPVSRGTERHARTSDSPLILADWLDELAGTRRTRAAASVQWLDPAVDPAWAWLLALLPILAAAAPAASLGLRRRA